MLRRRARLGHARIDDLTLDEALDCIAELVARGNGGTVSSPGVGHIVLLEEDARLREAYADATLVLADALPLVWASRLLGTPLRARISGAELRCPLLQLAADEQWRVYLVCGAVGAGERAAERMRREVPDLTIVGIDAAPLDLGRDPLTPDALVAGVVRARADLVLFTLGGPAQEIVMHRIASAVRPAVCIGLDRPGGEAERPWRRRWSRDPRFAWILLRQLCWSML